MSCVRRITFDITDSMEEDMTLAGAVAFKLSGGEYEEVRPSTKDLLAECEDVFMNGGADESGGDIELGVGHFYRVGMYIVRTDNWGFKDLTVCQSEQRAKDVFRDLQTRVPVIEDGA